LDKLTLGALNTGVTDGNTTTMVDAWVEGRTNTQSHFSSVLSPSAAGNEINAETDLSFTLKLT